MDDDYAEDNNSTYERQLLDDALDYWDTYYSDTDSDHELFDDFFGEYEDY